MKAKLLNTLIGTGKLLAIVLIVAAICIVICMSHTYSYHL